MKIFITGGRGFIAGRLADYLYLQGHSITIGTRNLNSNLSLNKKIKVVKINWNSYSSLKNALNGIDFIIHAAGPNAKDSVNLLLETSKFSKEGTANLLKAASYNGIQKLIYLSTAHVYASPLLGTINEETELTNQHPYAISHVEVENQIIASKKKYKINSLIFRISNSFGQPVEKKADCWYILINDICKQAVLTKKIIIKSNINITRNFIALTTVLNAIHFFIQNFESNKNKSNIINLGEKVSLSIEEVVNIVTERINNILGFSPKVIMQEKNNNKSNLIEKYLDYQTLKLQKKGFNRYYTIQEEVDDLINYCNKNF